MSPKRTKVEKDTERTEMKEEVERNSEDEGNGVAGDEHDEKQGEEAIKTDEKLRMKTEGEVVMEEIGVDLGPGLRVPGHRWSSQVPDVCLTDECILGIDEAGRGPVLGPMVYGTCYVPRSQEAKLRTMGCMDSKMLTEGKRDILFSKLNDASSYCGWGITVLPPSWICESQLKRCKYNLNTISHDTAMGLIQGVIDLGVNLVAVYLDTVGIPEKYRDLIKSRFPQLEVTVEKKADATYPCVSAASIAAKVSRDIIVKRWQFPEGVSPPSGGYGSGYPADPNTKKFLTQTFDPVFGFASFVRFSWSTISVILDDKAHSVRWEDDDEGSSKKSKKTEKPPDKFRRMTLEVASEATYFHRGTASVSKFFSSKRKANDDDIYDDEAENEGGQRQKEARRAHETSRHRFFALKSLQLDLPVKH